MARSPGISYVRSYSLNSGLFTFAVVSALLALSGCASVKAQQNAAKPHHTPDGFKNNYAANVTKSRSDFFRWQYQCLVDDLPKKPKTPTPTVLPGVAFIQSNANAPTMRPAITWIGHPTMLVQANDLKAKRSVGMHWGTFNLTDEPLDQPPKDLAAALLEQGLAPDVFTVLAIGEAHLPGACRALGIDSEKEPQRGQFLPDLQCHSLAMGQKAGEKWTAAALLQPMPPKSDRLLASRTAP